MARILGIGPFDEPLGELRAAALAVETHHEAVVVDLLDRAARLGEVGAAAGGDRSVAVDGGRHIRGLVGALRVAAGGALGLVLAQPAADYRLPALEAVVVWVIAVADVLAEQAANLFRVVALPGGDVGLEPPIHVSAVHRAHFIATPVAGAFRTRCGAAPRRTRNAWGPCSRRGCSGSGGAARRHRPRRRPAGRPRPRRPPATLRRRARRRRRRGRPRGAAGPPRSRPG